MLIVLLAIYALAVVTPDTFRAVFKTPSDQWPQRWYPIATLGFEADNSGKVVSVDSGGPADAKLHVGDVIDLSSVKPDRRPINIYVYVAHASTYTMRVIAGPDTPRDVGETEIEIG